MSAHNQQSPRGQQQDQAQDGSGQQNYRDYHPNPEHSPRAGDMPQNGQGQYSPQHSDRGRKGDDMHQPQQRRQQSPDSYNNDRKSDRGSPRQNGENGYDQRGGSPPREGRDYGDKAPPVQVYVGGIGRNIDDRHIRNLYAEYGTVLDVVMKNRYAFVEFENNKTAQAAIQATNGMNFQGHRLTVEEPKTKINERGERPRRAGPSSNDECWKCHQLGHWASECRNGGGGGGPRDRRHNDRGHQRRSYSRSRSPPPYRSRGGGRPYGRDRSDSRDRDDGPVRSKELREGLCFICKERGHLKRDCPELNRGRPGRMEGGGRRGGFNMDYRRRPSRSRSPYRQEPRNDYGGRNGYSPQRRRESPPRRSPPRRREYSRERSPMPQQRYRDSKSPDGRFRGNYNNNNNY